MIISKAFDVEIFINLFSVTFVNLQSYLNTFKDCVDEKCKPKALTECLSVAEIKRRLDTVEKDIFYISDTNDEQLLPLVAYINDMQSHYITTQTDNGVVQVPVRYDLFGFNSNGYDDLMIKGFMMHFNRFDNTKDLIKYLYDLSKTIIDLQSDKDLFYKDKRIELLRNYRLPYASVDVQQVYALHSAGVNVDKDTGERQKFAKSLKQTSINLKWHELLDFTLPPINEEEANWYRSHKMEYRGLTTENLQKLITNDFDRYVLPQYVKPMLYYNTNDVFLVCEVVRQKPDEIKLRYSITSAFGINVLSSARSNISDKLLYKFYSDMSGLRKKDFEKLRTERTRISFNKVIFPHITFKTPILQKLLSYMKSTYITRTSNAGKKINMTKLTDEIEVSSDKGIFKAEVDFYGTKYTLAAGGIHSQDIPRVLKSTDKYTYVHWDYTSYYPSIMISYNIAPKHLNNDIFVKMVSYFKDTRVEAKHTKDDIKQVVKGVPNKITAEALKIVINAIYGKLGSELFFLYDRLAQMKVTINGQLMTMSLIEALELEGIHCVSANTDGIVIKLPNDKRDVFKQITDEWNKVNKMSADGEEYKIVVSRDVNNYFDIQTTDAIEYKGSLDPKQYIKDLKKGYDMPVVALAVFNFFVYNTPVMETLRNHKDILDFCKTQNVGKQFKVVYETYENGVKIKHESQRHVRFFVSTKGAVIMKEHLTTGSQSKLASGMAVTILNSLDDLPIEERGINYSYYCDEAYKIIDPIKLGISPNQKANQNKGLKSGKVLLKKYSRDYQTLFDDEDYD